MPKVDAENDETSEKSRARSLFWKISSQFQLIGVITLIITLAVTLQISVSMAFYFNANPFMQKQKLAKCDTIENVDVRSKIAFSKKVFALGRNSDNDMVRGLLIDPDGRFEPRRLEKLKIPREMHLHGQEQVVMHKGQLIVYQINRGAKPEARKIFVLRGCRFDLLGELPTTHFQALSCT